eukprot:124307-Rhodomonas_salina.5
MSSNLALESVTLLHRSFSGHELLEDTSRETNTALSSTEVWACPRGLMPRGQSQVPSALDGKVSSPSNYYS